ncbi:MerR family transcriptional regulator [Longibacter sp.]|uniref:MerR family transcriptional regulator n=1 Tax=Longibacter sp. TaxID=2045415 RepID=UPI003EBD34DC
MADPSDGDSTDDASLLPASESPEDVLMDFEFLSRLVVGIGEVAKITDVPKRKLRYWQKKGLIDSVRDESGSTRRFDYVNIKKVLLIKELIDEGYTLDAAAEKVRQRMQMIDEAFRRLARQGDRQGSE